MSAPIGLTLSSRAMWGSWAYHQPSHLCFDAGETLSFVLQSRIFGITHLAIGHDDADHVNGLFSLIGLRAKTKGSTDKPLTILYPEGSNWVEAMRGLIAQRWRTLPYKLTWLPIAPGFRYALSSTRSLEAFRMEHRAQTPTLGYKLVEERHSLKPEYRFQLDSAPSAAKGAMVAGWRAQGIPIYDTKRAITFAYCLDHHTLDIESIRGADCAIMDCTFLDAADRDAEDKGHATLEESISRCVAAEVRTMVAAHISTRYHPDAFARALDKLSPPSSLTIVQCPTDRPIHL